MRIRNFVTAIATLIFLFSVSSASSSEDTLTVRTIEFDTDRVGWFDFPEAGAETYRKIVMNFLIKCPDGKPCGQWDYVSNVYIEHYFAPNYRLNGKSPEKSEFMTDTSWAFTPELIEGKWVLSQTAKEPILLELYNDDDNPTKATDSVYVWDVYHTYTIDDNGIITDSVKVAPDSVLYLSKKRVYFKDDVTLVERFEIMRYLTPYGINLDLGDGWLFEIDVTDFLPLLTGRVHIYAPCGGWGNQISNTDQEALQLSFDFIKGTPSRDIIRFEKYQTHNYAIYNANFENLFPPKEIHFSAEEKGAKLRVIQTGHGFGGNQDNCAEFCKKEANVQIDSVQRYARFIWRECGDIPMYPQGGTWVNDRTNWCPGMETEYHDYELTPYITPGSSHTIDYSMEYYNNAYTTGSNHIPHWVISSYLITYGEPNFNLDAEILDIINPSTKHIHSRFNPSCFNYAFKIRNNGKQDIQSIQFRYGFVGDENFNTYSWNGKLIYLDTTTVLIDDFVRNDDFSTTRRFFVEIVSVNGTADEYEANNFGYSDVEPVLFLPNEFTTHLKTNLYANEQYSFVVRDSQWNTIKQRTSFSNNFQYDDDFVLEDGCYDLLLQNRLGYGLYIFFMVDQIGRGSFKISSRGVDIKTFNPDFGNYIYRQIRTGPVPQVLFSADTVNFGNADIDDEIEQILEITPKNNIPLEIRDINLIFGSLAGFRIIETTPELTTGKSVWLAPGESMEVKLGFKPKKSGNAGTNLQISTNDYYNNLKTIRLIGFGNDHSSINTSNSSSASLQIDYNPISHAANIIIKIDDDIMNTRVNLFDSMGSLIKSVYNNPSFNGYDEFECSLDNLPSGVYYFVLTNGNQVSTKHIVITK